MASGLVSGIASKVINIDGVPKRSCLRKPVTNAQQLDSMVSSTLGDVHVSEKEYTPINVIDELLFRSVPVNQGVFESKDDGNTNHVRETNTDVKTGKPSYAATVKIASSSKSVNFRFMESLETQEGVDVVLPKSSVKLVQDKLANTLYGYFLGSREAFPVVDYYAKQNWKRFGLQKTMMNANGFFFFKFGDKKGLMSVLEGGPWLIRNKPIFLNVWSASTKLIKEDIKKVAVWVKIHDIPIAAYTDDGLSMIASKIGNPKVLDPLSTEMCMNTWGRSSFARALIEVSAEKDFKEVMTLAIPDLEGEEYSKEVIRVEYEWKPPRCTQCCIFGHKLEECPKAVRVTHNTTPRVDEEGFTQVTDKNKTNKAGFQLPKPKPKFEYRRVVNKNTNGATTSKVNNVRIKTANSFDVLGDDNLVDEAISRVGKEDRDGSARLSNPTNKSKEKMHGNSDFEEVENVNVEMADFMVSGVTTKATKGASTPSPLVIND